jgi:hypothetical protein
MDYARGSVGSLVHVGIIVKQVAGEFVVFMLYEPGCLAPAIKASVGWGGIHDGMIGVFWSMRVQCLVH